jgi:hypothetical protein
VKVQVRFHDTTPSAAQRSYGHRVAHYHLSRFGREIELVTLRVQPTPLSGNPVGARCEITVRGPNVHATRIDVLSSDPMLAMDAAADWASRTVGRLLNQPPQLEPAQESELREAS